MTTEAPTETSDLHAHVFTLARLLKSADKALVILRMHELLQRHNAVTWEGRKWVSYPIADWHEQHFTWAGKSKVRDLLDSLDHEHNLLIRTKERVFKDRPAYDRTVSYSLDYDKIWALLLLTPEDLPTERNKRLPADDPNKKQPITVGFRDDMPTPADDQPPRLQLSAFGGEFTTPQPGTKYRASLIGDEDGEILDIGWDSEYGFWACSISDYLKALEWTRDGERRKSVHPRNIPNVVAYIGRTPVELHVPRDFHGREQLEAIVAKHFGFIKQGNRWGWQGSR